jgi:eukaryotic-like serine/threonine-protein kinase
MGGTEPLLQTRLTAPSRIGRLFAELKRRRVFRVLVAYATVSFVVGQAASFAFPALQLPDWTLTFVVALLVLGLPIALALSWAYDVTPHGLERTPPAGRVATSPMPAGPADPDAVPPADGAGVDPADSAPRPPAPAASPADRAAGPRACSAGDPERKHLVVLPFRMLRPDDETDFLSFSLPDAISSSLAASRSLVVRSTLTAACFGDGAPDLDVLAGAGVNVVLTGTLLRVGERLRVSTQLAEARDGVILWSQTSEAGLEDLFGLQDALTRRILDSLSLSLTPQEHHTAHRTAPASARAYELYLRANHLCAQGGRFEEPRKLYLESLDEDPDYAPAWARLGRCYRVAAKYALDPGSYDALTVEAEVAFRRAFELNPRLAIAHHLYTPHQVEQGRAPEAIGRLLGRIRESDADPELFAGLVHACRFSGLLEESATAHRRARALDPGIRTSVVHTFFMQGRYDRAEEEVAGEFGVIGPLTAAMQGRTDEALRIGRLAAAAMAEEMGADFPGMVKAVNALLAGDDAAARAAAHAALAWYRDPEGRFYGARILARLGDADAALREIEDVLGRGYACARQLRDDPWLEAVRRLPRFDEVAARADAAVREAAARFEAADGPRVLGALAARA